MFHKLIEIIDSGQAFTIEQLCLETGLGKAAVKARIEYLEHTGYLQQVHLSTCADNSCNGCEKNCGGDHQLTASAFPTLWEKSKER